MFNVSPAGSPPPSTSLAGSPDPACAAAAVPRAPPPRGEPPARSPAAREGWPTPWRVLYGLYAWLQFLLVGLVTLTLLLLPGTLERRRRLVGGAARLALRLAGMRVSVVADALSAAHPVSRVGGLPVPCVIVANHCSYLDGVLLAGLLPSSFSFVIKREMAAVPLAGLLLHRIGVEFMERHNHGRVLRDTRRVLRRAAGGQALVFFPEGTFSPEIGLLHFHIGAFAAATRARLPVVPLAIRGTRHCLPPGSLWPRPGRIDVQVLPPISTTAADRLAAADGLAAPAALRERTRAALLAVLGEPDLANVATRNAERMAAPAE